MNKRHVGTNYEKLAGAWLEKRGYRILEYNFRSRRGEIDIVARDGSYLVFVEVKYRGNTKAGSPLEAVNLHKQKMICMAARFYLMAQKIPPETPCRFDVVGIRGEEFLLVKDAFPFIGQGMIGF